MCVTTRHSSLVCVLHFYSILFILYIDLFSKCVTSCSLGGSSLYSEGMAPSSGQNSKVQRFPASEEYQPTDSVGHRRPTVCGVGDSES